MEPPVLYPLCVNIRDRLCVVVGGGRVALRKTRGLLDAQARVRVIASDCLSEFIELSASGRVELLLRRYQPDDIVGGPCWILLLRLKRIPWG